MGSVKVIRWGTNDLPVYGGLSVHCSCPDGERQKAASIRGALHVCKHAAAALDSVIDPGAGTLLQAAAKKRKADLEAQLRMQEAQLPGERERIEHGVATLGANEIVRLIRERAGAVDGLRCLVALFPHDAAAQGGGLHAVRAGVRPAVPHGPGVPDRAPSGPRCHAVCCVLCVCVCVCVCVHLGSHRAWLALPATQFTHPHPSKITQITQPTQPVAPLASPAPRSPHSASTTLSPQPAHTWAAHTPAHTTPRPTHRPALHGPVRA